MKAIEYTTGPDTLRLTEVPDPTPAPGEVVIDIAATAVNRADLLQTKGHYPPPPGASEILGLECSGRISAIGEGVQHLTIGDEVCAPSSPTRPSARSSRCSPAAGTPRRSRSRPSR